MKRAMFLTPILAGLLGCNPNPYYGCSSDRDCKGDRICDPVQHICVNPPGGGGGSPDGGGGADLGGPGPGPDLGGRPAGAFLWSKRFGGAGHDQAFATAVDRGGNIVVAGSFEGSADFGGGPLTSQGGADVFLARFTSDGAYVWAERFGGPGDDQAYGVAIDGSGNIVIAGAFTGTSDFGGGALTSAGGYDALLASYADDGKHRWSRALGGRDDDAASSVTVDDGGNLAITGYFSGTANFGGTDLTSAGSLDVFVARYGADGKHLWSKGFGGPDDDFGNRLAADRNGALVVTGYFHSRASFGGAALVSAGMSDVFVARYGADGKHLWSKGFGGAKDEAANAVAVDGSGNPALFGYFQSNVDFGGGPLVASGPLNLFLVKLGADGKHQWSKRFGGNALGYAGNLAADASGALAIVGSFNDRIDLGGGELISGGIFAARYDGDGTHRFSRRFGGNDNTDGNGVAFDNAGGLVLAGDFRGTIDFGGGPQKSAGDYDAFLLRLAP